MKLEDAIRLYERVGKRNIEFLSKWLHDIYLNTFLPCIELKYKDKLALDKTKLTIFDVLVDDLVDNREMINLKLLDQFMRIPWGVSSTSSYVNVGKSIWEDCMRSIRKYPRFEEFGRMFYFDLRQVLAAMEYSLLVNTMRLDNPIEVKIYPPHAYMVLLHCDMDLMCSPDFDMKELGNMRAIFYMAQKVAHIGNMLNTYPKEVLEKDFSCPLISLALRRGLIRKEGLDESVLPKLKKLEPLFKQEAETCIEKVRNYENKIKSVDMSGFSDALAVILEKFLSRPQYWKF
jgi:hypothetical protein